MVFDLTIPILTEYRCYSDLLISHFFCHIF